MYGGTGGGISVDVARHTGVDSFGAATAQGCLAGATYTTLCRRRKLAVSLPYRAKDEPLPMVVDATGIKVYGEGEWKVRCHGGAKQRT